MLTTAQADDFCDNRFCSLLNWDQNGKGNWTRKFKGQLLTVFQRDGWWGWCINAGKGKATFSPLLFRTEGKAMANLEQSLLSNRTIKLGKSVVVLKGLSQGVKPVVSPVRSVVPCDVCNAPAVSCTTYPQ